MDLGAFYHPLATILIHNIHSKTICEIRKDTALYNSVINSIYCVDGVYDGVIRCCIFPYFTDGFAVIATPVHVWVKLDKVHIA